MRRFRGAANAGIFWAILFAAVSALSWQRGTNVVTDIFGRYLWSVTYGSGFIRRGLLGTLAHPFVESKSVADLDQWILGIHTFAALALIVALSVWLAITIRATDQPRARTVLGTLALVMAASQIIPTIALTPGWPDVWLSLLFVGAVIALAMGRVWPASLLACVGVLAHEAFAFYVIVLIAVGVALRRRYESAMSTRLLLVWAAAPLVVAGAVLVLSNRQSAFQEMVHGGVSAEEASRVANEQFGQPLREAMARMVELHLNYPHVEVLAIVAYLGPAIAMALGYAFARRRSLRSSERVALVLAAVVPWTVTLVAFDLSRLLAMGNLIVLAVILGLESSNQDALRAPPAMLLGLWVIVAISLSAPATFASFDRVTLFNHQPPTIVKFAPLRFRE